MIQEENIPKTIILTWKNKKIPKYIIEKWEKLNPEFNINFFDDEKIIEFLNKEYDYTYSSFFKKIKFGRYKADFFRYCYLYKYGGYYFDIDIEPLEPIKNIFNNSSLTTVLSTINNNIFQAVLIVGKNNPIIKKCINDMFHYGYNIGINPPDIPPYHGHPTKCMYLNISEYTNIKLLKEGIIILENESITLGKEVLYQKRIAIRINNKIFGFSRYENYSRENGF